MKHIDWWKVASMAMLAASAIMSFGHDLIEDKKTEEDLQDVVQEEVRRQKRTSKREKYRLLYGREIQFEQSKGE